RRKRSSQSVEQCASRSSDKSNSSPSLMEERIVAIERRSRFIHSWKRWKSQTSKALHFGDHLIKDSFHRSRKFAIISKDPTLLRFRRSHKGIPATYIIFRLSNRLDLLRLNIPTHWISSLSNSKRS